MICEFALTPQLFDSASHGADTAWLRKVERLILDFFPRTGHHPVCVSDLFEGGWRREAGKMADACDPAVRADVKRMLARVSDILVERNQAGDWPEDEKGWATEALSSSTQTQEQCQINRIWTTSGCHSDLADIAYTRIDEVASDACWNGVRPSRAVGMTIPAQLEALRPLVFHSTWIGYVSPYLQGSTTNDEMDLAVELLIAARERNRASSVYLLDLHTEIPVTPANVLSSIQHRFPLTDGSFRVRCFFWPRLLDRYLMFGDTARALEVAGKPKIRWAVAPMHFARRADQGVAKPDTPWNLMTRTDLGRVYDQFYSPIVPSVSNLIR